MKLPLIRSAMAAGLALSLVTGSTSAQAPKAEQHGVRSGDSMLVRRPGAVSGTAWHRDDTPVAHALLRLRDVATGQIVMNVRADAAGRFTFSPVAAGSYLVELVDEDGQLKALGQMFSIAPGETVATFIRLGVQVAWYHGFFTNAAAAALASAASLGVTAVGDGVQPASARR